MIRSFRERDTLAFYEGKRIKRFDGFRDQATRRLQMLEDATELGDLAGVPGNRLEALSGDRRGRFSLRINAQWRVCFKWGSDGAYEVEIVDYH
jgi:proteic killer suppression protein